MSYLAQLISSPWALQRELLPLAARVLERLAAGAPMSEADRAAVENGKVTAAARRQQSEQYAAGNGGAIALVPIVGVLTPRGEMTDMSTPTLSTLRLASQIRQLAADPSVSAIVIDCDSRGGSVGGVEELAQAIYDARGVKPVTAVANGLAASAAFWAISQASELYCAPGGMTGSIGCYALHVDASKALEADGLSVTTISAGKYKTEMSATGPLSDEARAYGQSQIDTYYRAFLEDVARGRRTTAARVRTEMGEGRTVLADAAKAANMVDGVATLAQVIGKMQARLQRGSATATSSTPRLAAMQRATLVAEAEAEL